MSDESTETTKTAETLSETLDRLVGDEKTEGVKLGEREGAKFGLSIANFPTAPEPSNNEILTPVNLEQSGPSLLAVGGHKRIREPIGLRSKRTGAKEPQAGHHIEE
jgi:hypothetical protein